MRITALRRSFGHKQEYPVVLVRFADAPTGKQLGGIGVDVGVGIDVVDYHCYNLCRCLAACVEQQRVDAGLSGRRYNAVGVNEMLCVVGKLYVRQVVDLIYACGGRERHNHCKDI